MFGEGGKLETDNFLMLLGYVAALDSDLSPSLMDDLAFSLKESSFTTFASLGANSVLGRKLALI